MSETEKMTQQNDCLSIKGGHLYMEGVDTTELQAQYGSPLYVMSEGQLRNNFRRYKRAFQQVWSYGPVDVLPASKSNWNLAIAGLLAQEGAGMDIYSEGELWAALESGISPALISANGNGKSDEMLEVCIAAGVRLTVEDPDEPGRINAIAGRLGRKAHIRLRLKPEMPQLWRKSDWTLEHVPIESAVQLYKSGIPIDLLEGMMRESLELPHVELVGFHYHFGRHSDTEWFWREQMRSVGELVGRLCKAFNYKPRELDIGGGFASARDPFNKNGRKSEIIESFFSYPLEILLNAVSSRLRYGLLGFLFNKLFVKTSRNRSPMSIEQYAQAAVGGLKMGLAKAGMVDLDGIALQVEPGRGLFGDAGIHLATVKKMKRQRKPYKMNWVLTNTTTFFMSAGLEENNFYDFVVANKADAEKTQMADIVGHSCFPDRILPFVKVPDLVAGDQIAFLGMGCYQECSASNFNAFARPAVVLVNGEHTEVIRRGETREDVFARDVVPERLKRSSRSAQSECAA